MTRPKEEAFQFDYKKVEVKGCEVNYLDLGTGQVIIFSHAAVGSSFMYRELIQNLSRFFRCIALDYPGFGLSTAPEKYSCNIRTQAEIMRAFVHKLNLENLIILGHDTGGPSAFCGLCESPDLVSALILTDTIIFPVGQYKKIDRMLKFLDTSVFRWANRRFNLLTRLTVNFGLAKGKLPSAVKEQYLAFYDTAQKRNRMIDVLSSLRSEREVMERVEASFSNEFCDKPVLLIYGDKDPVHELKIPERIASLLNKGKLYLIKNEGHFPHEGSATEMSDIIRNWIEENNFNLIK